MKHNDIKIPQGREDLKAKLIELYRRDLPDGIIDIVSAVQLKHQFINSDEQSFRERVRHELQEAVLEIRSNHFYQSPVYWYEFDGCTSFICRWLEIVELGLPDDVKDKIVSEVAGEVFGSLAADAKNNTNYEVVRNIEIFCKGTSELIFNKYIYTQAGG